MHDERVRKKFASEFIFLLTRLGSASGHCCWLTYGNSDLLYVEGPEYQPMNDEHRHSGMVF